MADRQDIDALMVGALYGELDAAESARLESHLSSHPEDRAAMQGLEQARAAVRRGIADLPAAEPPQAISAVLLQAAARRAPGRIASEPAGDGLWARFVEWFRRGAMHPAVAAAAVLVLVAGTATALWVRGKGGVAEPAAEPADHAAGPTATAPAKAEQRAAAAGSSAPTADLYEVDTAEADGLARGAADVDGKQKAKLDEGDALVRAPEKPTVPGGTKDERRRDAKPTASGFEVGSADKEPAVMDMPSPDDELKLEVPADEGTRDQSGAATGAAAGAAGAAAQPAPEPKTDAPADEQWARTAHTRLVKLVSAGKCPEAGRLGAEIKDRAPEYYAANVANDRGIRQCKQYIETRAKKKAEKAYKSRSQQNTYDDAAESPSSK